MVNPRKALLAAALVGAAALNASPSPTRPSTTGGAINPVTELTRDSFREPPANDRPWVRWNWPPAAVTIPQLEAELEQLAAAGIRGVEIGQGGNPTNEQLTAILKKANALGITVGIKYSGGAPITGTLGEHQRLHAQDAEQQPDVRRRGGDVQRPRAGHRHDRRRAGLPLHGVSVPGHGRARDRSFFADRPHLTADRHEHRRLLRRHDRGQPELDRSRLPGRRAVGRGDVPRRRAAERARGAQQGGHGRADRRL